MKNFRRIFGMCLVLLASAGLVVACGPETSSDCSFDTDCATGEACLQPPADDNRCVTDCSADANACGEGSECSDRFGTGDATQVCVPDDLLCSQDEDCPGDITCGGDGFCDIGGDTEPECTSDSDCDEAAGEVCDTAAEMCVSACTDNDDCDGEDVCNTETGFCESTGTIAYRYIEVTDTTDIESDACVNPSDADPGSDFLTAEILIDGQDAGIWAKAVNWAPIDTDESGNTNALSSPPTHVVDGVAPSYSIDTGECPDSFAGNDDEIMALGCGGKIWLEFVDSDGASVEIPTDGSADIYVYEFGSPLCGSDTDDTYSVELCEVSRDDITAAAAPGDVDCTGQAIIPEGQGEGAATDITVE